MNKLQKYLKPVSQNLGIMQFPSLNGLDFQVKKQIWKLGKKFFHIFARAFLIRTTRKIMGRFGLLQNLDSSCENLADIIFEFSMLKLSRVQNFRPLAQTWKFYRIWYKMMKTVLGSSRSSTVRLMIKSISNLNFPYQNWVGYCISGL